MEQRAEDKPREKPQPDRLASVGNTDFETNEKTLFKD